MTQEQKAKAYDEAIERAKEYWETDNDNTLDIKAKGTMEYLFPELKESEDERMKKTIIHALRGDVILNKKQATRAIAWLEKQGEQKPTWSKDDEDLLTSIEDSLSDYLDYIREDKTLTTQGMVKLRVLIYIDWLKSFKQRIGG